MFAVSNTKQSTYGNFLLKWFLNSTLLNKIVDNIQLHIREVHLRYEDHVTCPTDFAVGLSLESLHMQSREPEHTIPGSIPKGRLHLRGNNTFHKHAQINHLAGMLRDTKWMVFILPTISLMLFHSYTDVCLIWCIRFLSSSILEPSDSYVSRCLHGCVCRQIWRWSRVAHVKNNS